MRIMIEEYSSNVHSDIEATKLAGDAIISKQISSISIPRRFTHMARDIWTLQARLKQTKRKSYRVLMHPRFRAAYDLLLLRAQSGEPLNDLVEYWTKEQLQEPQIGKSKIKTRQKRNNSNRNTKNSKKKDL